MYENYWRLTKKPFGTATDPSLYYPSENHQAAIAKMRYALENDRGVAVLEGAAGSGKTLVVKLLLAQLPEHLSPRIHLVFPPLDAAGLMATLAHQLETRNAGATLADDVAAIERRLRDNAARGRRAILAIAEAHLIEGQQAWEAIRLVTNFECDAEPCVSLVLAGQTGLMTAIERRPHLEERLGAKCALKSLSLEETMSYVQHRLQACGRTDPTFEPEALERIHELGRGIPRRINRLCDLALLVGFAEELSTIDASRIEEVERDLQPA